LSFFAAARVRQLLTRLIHAGLQLCPVHLKRFFHFLDRLLRVPDALHLELAIENQEPLGFFAAFLLELAGVLFREAPPSLRAQRRSRAWAAAGSRPSRKSACSKSSGRRTSLVNNTCAGMLR